MSLVHTRVSGHTGQQFNTGATSSGALTGQDALMDQKLMNRSTISGSVTRRPKSTYMNNSNRISLIFNNRNAGAPVGKASGFVRINQQSAYLHGSSQAQTIAPGTTKPTRMLLEDGSSQQFLSNDVKNSLQNRSKALAFFNLNVSDSQNV